MVCMAMFQKGFIGIPPLLDGPIADIFWALLMERIVSKTSVSMIVVPSTIIMIIDDHDGPLAPRWLSHDIVLAEINLVFHVLAVATATHL